MKKTDLPRIYDFNKFIGKSTMSTSSILIKRSIIKDIRLKMLNMKIIFLSVIY